LGVFGEIAFRADVVGCDRELEIAAVGVDFKFFLRGVGGFRVGGVEPDEVEIIEIA
jgi:hypothetical protein